MNHVVEHLYDPLETIRECRRLLKPDGVLVAVTPNIESHGYRCFGTDWRGLEPPRHLNIFSRRTLQSVAAKAGFHRIETWTTAAKAETIALGSLSIRQYGRYDMGEPSDPNLEMKAILFQVRATIAHLRDPSSGEECVLKAVK